MLDDLQEDSLIEYDFKQLEIFSFVLNSIQIVLTYYSLPYK